jgi:hypothetical protein
LTCLGNGNSCAAAATGNRGPALQVPKRCIPPLRLSRGMPLLSPPAAQWLSLAISDKGEHLLRVSRAEFQSLGKLGHSAAAHRNRSFIFPSHLTGTRSRSVPRSSAMCDYTHVSRQSRSRSALRHRDGEGRESAHCGRFPHGIVWTAVDRSGLSDRA